jgi:hypothetical protein
VRVRLALVLSTALLLAAFGGPALAQSGDATVHVVHGIPGTPVDVYVNAELTLDDFQPGTVTDGLSLPAGAYQVDIRAADAAADAEPVLSGSADVPAGADVSLVAHLDAAGDPALSPFVNDVSRVPAGQARVTVRHTAAAPAVDVLAGGSPVLRGVTNGQEGSLTVPAGTVSAAVALAGTTEPVLGPADLDLEEGTLTVVYAIGSAEGGTLDLLTQTLSGLHSGAGIESGTGGDAARAGLPGAALAVLVAAGLLAAASGARLAVLRGRR